jgi:hypothetical protein
MNQIDRPRLRKSPALAGFLSMLPGLGQAYVGYYVSGFINIAVIGALVSLLESKQVRGAEPFLGMFLAFFWVFNIIDAVRKAKLYNLSAVGETELSVPTDSPLLGGIALVVIGLILTLTVTFDLDMYWLEDVWPLFLLGLGLYLLWRYQTARRQLENGRAAMSFRAPAAPHSAPPLTPPFPPSAGDDDDQRLVDRSE